MRATIRRAAESDAPGLLRLNEKFNGKSNLSAEQIRLSLAVNDREDVFVAEQEGKLVGFCCVQIFQSFCYEVRYAEITELYVDDAYQRRISRKVSIIGGGQAPVVVAPAGASGGESQPDFRLLPTGQLSGGPSPRLPAPRRVHAVSPDGRAPDSGWRRLQKISLTNRPSLVKIGHSKC